MQKLGGAAIHMRQNFVDFRQFDIQWQVGNAETMDKMQKISPLEPFSEKITGFLAEISKEILIDKSAKKYSDVVTFAFWIRKASIEQMRKHFSDHSFRLGRGIVFHVAPSNVPVNYAYSLVAGLLCGNANVVRIPSKEFPQVSIINSVFLRVLENHEDIKPYLVLIRYGHDSKINDAFSTIADLRVIWGGDETIHEIRKSPLQPRATEITFADRYSLTVINAEAYMEIEDKQNIANDFYNDTYLTDQNACTSPRAVIWMGEQIELAKQEFWKNLRNLLIDKYELQGEQAVNKLTSAFVVASDRKDVKIEHGQDNLIVRIKVDSIDADLMDLKDNSGFFFEYDCKNVMELRDICNDTRCQTVSYTGDKKLLEPLLRSGVRGIDRIVPVGKTMDFDLIWDGYNLFERMTRIIVY